MGYQLSIRERIVNTVIRTMLRVACKLRVGELKTIARSGPVILITNHTTNIEGPALYILLQPRKATALGKIELWQNPVTRFLMDTWGVIPVKRGRVDSGALRASIQALEQGSLLGVAPEGTRSKSGVMKRAERGVAMLALRTGAPVYPAAQWGFRDLGANLKRFRRTPVTIRVGSPFVVRAAESDGPAPHLLREIADEMMYRISAMLPTQFRGVYGDLGNATTKHLRFLKPDDIPAN